MTDLLRHIEIGEKVALDWLRYSLGQGDVLSTEMLTVVQDRLGRSYALAPANVAPARLTKPREGGVSKAADARDALGGVLDSLAKRGAACVVVEDEMRLKRDPKPSLDGLLPTAFLGERVIHWSGLARGGEAAVRVLHDGSGGYPLNAFVTSVSAEELGLVDDADVDADIAGAVVQSVVAVIVAAYDAESFIIWEPASKS